MRIAQAEHDVPAAIRCAMEIVGRWPPSTPTATGSPLVDFRRARAIFDGDNMREHITDGNAATVHAARAVTADTSHAVLREKTTRAALYVATTLAADPTAPTCTGARPRRPNTATRSRRAPRAAPNSPANDWHRCARTDRIRTRRRNRSKRPPTRVARPLIDRRTHCVQARRAAYRQWCSKAQSCRPVTNRGSTNTFTNRLTTASSCSAGPYNLAAARDEFLLLGSRRRGAGTGR